MSILRNSVRCLKCDEEIESTHRHDFKQCPCGSVFVDGGKDYLRRGIRDWTTSYEETSIFDDDGEGTE